CACTARYSDDAARRYRGLPKFRRCCACDRQRICAYIEIFGCRDDRASRSAMREINLLGKLPRGRRNAGRAATAKTDEHVRISREYGELYFDGPREYGYGGYRYDGRWLPVALDMIEHFGLRS